MTAMVTGIMALDAWMMWRLAAFTPGSSNHRAPSDENTYEKTGNHEIQVDPQNDGNNYVVTGGLKSGDKYVTNGITKLSDQMEIVPITPERYQEKIGEQAKAMGAKEIVDEAQKAMERAKK